MATFRVTTLVDEDDGAGSGAGLSLREAVKLANTFAGPDRIEFSAAVGGKGSLGDDHRGVGVVDLPAKVYSNIVHIEPGESFADAMAGQPAGTLYIVGQGAHYEQQVIPQHGDAFIGEPGAVMTGAYEIPRSTWSSGHFKIDLSGIHDVDLSIINETPVKDQIIHSGLHEGYVPKSIWGYPEQLFVTTRDGETILIQREEPHYYVRQLHQAWFGQEVTGFENARWSLDYGTGFVTLRNFDKKQVEKVELATKKFAFGYDAQEFAGAYGRDRSLEQPLPDSPADMPNIYDPNDPYYDKPRDVVIQNLTIEKYANPAQTGAIGYYRPGLDWLVENNEVRWNNGTGIKFRGDHAIVRDNVTHHNGQFGMAAGDGENAAGRESYGNMEEWGFYGGYAGNGGLVQNNEITHNRLATIGIDRSWGAGGTKFVQTFNLHVLDNDVYENDGRGLWSDFPYAGTLYQDNRVDSNGADGIFVEHSLAPTRIIGNTAFGNGKADTIEGFHGAQIAVMSSPLVEVSGNTVMTHPVRGNGIVVTNGDMNGFNVPRHIEGVAVQGFGSYIHDNTILIDGSPTNGTGYSEGGRWTGGQSGITTKDKDFFYLPSANRFADNDYYFRDADGAWRQAEPDDHGFWRWSPPEVGDSHYPAFLEFAEWQARGQDAPGGKALVHRGSSATDAINGGDGDDSIYLGAGDDIGRGGGGRDFIAGEGGADMLSGGADRDVLSGGAGNDVLKGDGDIDYLLGDNGDDILAGGPGPDVLEGGLGFDTADYSSSPAAVTLLLSNTDQYGVGGVEGTKNKPASLTGGDADGDSFVGIEGVIGSNYDDLVYGFDAIKGYLDSGRTGLLVESRKGTWADLGGGADIFDNSEANEAVDTVFGGAGNDKIWTGAGNDELYGGPDNDFLSGEAGDDTLRGDGGEDSLYGGAGADILYGGADRDQFIIEDPAHSRPSLRDHVQDFELGVDRINLSAIDANLLLPGNQAFDFIGTRPFSGLLLPATPGQVRVSDRGSETLVQWNTDFDRDQEGEVLVNDGALTAGAWGSAAFVL